MVEWRDLDRHGVSFLKWGWGGGSLIQKVLTSKKKRQYVTFQNLVIHKPGGWEGGGGAITNTSSKF